MSQDSGWGRQGYAPCRILKTVAGSSKDRLPVENLRLWLGQARVGCL